MIAFRRFSREGPFTVQREEEGNNTCHTHAETERTHSVQNSTNPSSCSLTSGLQQAVNMVGIYGASYYILERNPETGIKEETEKKRERQRETVK